MENIKNSDFKFKIKNPLPTIKNFFTTKQHIWISFLIPFAILLCAYAYFGVYPFNNKSVLSLDLNAQYSYYFAYMKDVLVGDESLLYSWSRNLSGEFVGIIGYYLFSPFNFLVWVFPLSHLTEGLLLMILTKIGFAGVTMSIYLKSSRGFSKHTSVLFSIMYALTSYNIVQTMNPMWLDGVIIFPLVMMGIESLFKHNKYKLLIFSLTYSFVTCFYIGYMIGIFSAIYFVYYALTSRKLNKPNFVVVSRRAGLFAVCAVTAVMMSAFIILPVYSALSMGKLEFSNPDYSIKSNFEFLEITRKMFVNSYDTVRMDGMPFIYCGILAIIMIPAYFFCNRIRRARRFGGIVLMIILVFSMKITPIDMFWHGMQNPNWLPYRYSFILCFLILAFGAEAFENIQRVPKKTLGVTGLFFSLLLFYWESVDTVNPSLGNDGREVFDWFASVIPSLIIVIAITAFLILAKDKLNRHNIFTASLIALVSIELLFNTQNSIDKQHTDIVYSTRDSFNDIILPIREVTDKINDDDDGFFRMEKNFNRSANDPMALRMKGATHSSSMLNDSSIALLKNLGHAARSHMSRYVGSTPLTDDLFGYKYILDAPENKRENVKAASDIIVTKNDDVMPIAYLTDPKLLTYEFSGKDSDDVFINQSRLLSYMLGDEEKSYFVKMEIDDKRPQNLDYEGMGDNYMSYKRVEGSSGDAHIEYDIIPDEDGDYYMYFPSIYERKCNLWVDGRFIGNVYETDNHHIHYLGKFEKGNKFKMTLSLPKDQDKVFFREENIMRLDRELLEADMARLHEKNKNTVFEAVTNRHLKITTNSTENSLLFTSIPCEPGWKATLNGEKVEIDEIIEVMSGKDENGEKYKKGSLMGINVPAGENVIEFKFFPNHMAVGIIISIGGVLVLIFLCFFFNDKNAKIRLEKQAERQKNKIVKVSKSSKSLKGSKQVKKTSIVNNAVVPRVVMVAKDEYDGFDPDYVDDIDVDTGIININTNDNNSNSDNENDSDKSSKTNKIDEE